MNEFDIIEQYFNTQMIQRKDVVLGIGDDAAIVRVAPDHELALTTDTLISGVHFFENTAPYDIGFKSLAVNLSDLAAMGATPTWFLLSLTLPKAQEIWLKEFSRGLFDLANNYQTQLIGGDLTHGPLSITIQAGGWVKSGDALKRSGAKPGDLIYVTHTLGDAALALEFLHKKVTIAEKDQSYILSRLNRPTPQIHIGEALRSIATAAIDISDGLAADLSHILEKSKVGAKVIVNQIPLSAELLASVSIEQALQLALNGGDDYELCFTVPKDNVPYFHFNCTCIGEITAQLGLDLMYKDGKKYALPVHGYQHF